MLSVGERFPFVESQLMSELNLLSRESCAFDIVSLGEVMLRFDPGERRIHTTRTFDVSEGGGEYNVARGLRRAFDQRVAILTALVDNPVGRLVEDLMLQGGVDTSFVHWVHDDGAGRRVRNGLNFTERGFGVRGAVGCSDRGHTAISQTRTSDFALQQLLARGVRWLHTGGIFAALSDLTSETALEVIRKAKEAGAIVSYDLNFRPSLWKEQGGRRRAQEVNRRIVESVDVLFGNEEDFSEALGFEVSGVDPSYQSLPMESFRAMIERVVREFPGLKAVATSLRAVHSATENDWGGLCYHLGDFHEVEPRRLLVLDRVGGGDSFASGFIYGLMEGMTGLQCLKYAVAHGALAMTTPGDTTMARLKDVRDLVSEKGARIDR